MESQAMGVRRRESRRMKSPQILIRITIGRDPEN
jgi:hypothetical protein